LSKACLVLCNARTGVQPGVKEKKSHKLNAGKVTNWGEINKPCSSLFQPLCQTARVLGEGIRGG
jgi:hypothetical protein